jgi:hypothetical protein
MPNNPIGTEPTKQLRGINIENGQPLPLPGEVVPQGGFKRDTYGRWILPTDEFRKLNSRKGTKGFFKKDINLRDPKRLRPSRINSKDFQEWFRALANPKDIECVYKAILSKAKTGDIDAAKLYLDRILGKAPSNQNITIDETKTARIEFRQLPMDEIMRLMNKLDSPVIEGKLVEPP